MIENQIWLDNAIKIALEEDLGCGDLTTDAIIDPARTGKAALEAREVMILAGMPVFKRTFELVNRDIEMESYYEDGQEVGAGERICLITGSLSAILKAERTALNFIQRMSGIATLTRKFVDKTRSFDVKIVDTRKTAPGLRMLDKYSVRVGGGYNHRMGLFDGILIKDNHIAAAGSIRRAVTLAKEKAPHTIRVEVEVEDLEGLEEAIDSGADIVLLDNMNADNIRKAVKRSGGRVIIEVSGGIRLDNIEEFASTGVNLISVGALTHSAASVDVSLEVII